MSKLIFLLIPLFAFTNFSIQAHARNTKDSYEKMMERIDNGDTTVDFRTFRDSFLESKKYWERSSQYGTFKKEIHQAFNENKPPAEIISIGKKMIEADYTSRYGHMYLERAYEKLGDKEAAEKHHNILVQLVRSILNSGDGESCETSWHVIKVEEEYFIINVLGATFEQQTLLQGKGNICDLMSVKLDDQDKEIYFEINGLWKKEAELFKK